MSIESPSFGPLGNDWELSNTDKSLNVLLELSHRGSATAEGCLFNTLKVLEESPNVCYILDDRRRLVYSNPTWDRFAEENGAPELVGEALIGTDLFAAIPNVLASAYAEAFASVEATGRVWTKAYECFSPDMLRRFQMRIHFLKSRRWFLVTNALIVERPHENVEPSAERVYFDRGVITMCAHCRCVRQVGSHGGWDFVPYYLQLKGLDLLKISHGLCPICQAYFYPGV